MPKHIFYYCTNILLLCCLLSCSTHSGTVDEIFSDVETSLEQNPDSALTLLDSIQNPYVLNKKQYFKYILLSVQSRDKAYKDIASDTLIFQSRDYFQKKNDFIAVPLKSQNVL